MELNNQARLSESGWPVPIASALGWESPFIPRMKRHRRFHPLSVQREGLTSVRVTSSSVHVIIC